MIAMNKNKSIEKSHLARSESVRDLVQCSDKSIVASSLYSTKLPKTIVHFWHNLDQIPSDVRKCIETWDRTKEQGFERELFDKRRARDYIRCRLGLRYKKAYDMCYHPAMQSDYFRLCYILLEGGCYIDADDMYDGSQIQHLFSDRRLKIQPLCYDKAMHMMIPPAIFTKPGANNINWIFYFNNNPLIAGKGHPLIRRALAQATRNLEKDIDNDLPEIQSTTGPGNLTKTIIDVVNKRKEICDSLLVLRDWENIARNKWNLSYRNDARNWRLSNCRAYKE
jgi:mannosyltransferase OCH1-like enzyme